MPTIAASPRVLVIDDQDLQLRLMSLLLEQAFPGVRVTTSGDPAAALALCDTQDFDCVVADYQMPGMDGLSLASRLRAVRPFLAIVLCTGGGDEMLVAQAMTSGVTQYLPKTRVSPDSLRRTLSHAMQIMQQTRQIADQREELENFAFALAHDFKQPIRQITTFSSLIGGAVAKDADPEIELHLRYLREAAARLGRLVDVMSQYALLGKAPELGRVDVGEVLHEVAFALAPYLTERCARLEIGEMLVAFGNGTLMAQVLQNLIVNGVKYNQSAEPVVRVTCETRGQEIVIAVVDNGIGIDAEHHEQIFKPLVRLHTNEAFEGSGLGLAMTRKAIIVQNGTVWCKSQLGAGSEFFVRLPAWTPLSTSHEGKRAA